MEKIQIKKVTRKIYNLDYSNVGINSDEELIIEPTGVSELTQYFRKIDMDTGVIVTPTSYQYGLFYTSDNDGELYSSNKMTPDLVTFGLNLLGLKKGFFYRITVIARDTGVCNLITPDRTITVVDNTKQIVINSDLKDYGENQNLEGIFRATCNEANLFFTIGKIIIKDIIIDEVVLAEEEKLHADETEGPDELIPGDKESLAAYGVFNLKPEIPELFKGKFIELDRHYGKGISLFYDIEEKTFYLERDNKTEILTEPFTNINYRIDFNFNKIINNGIYDKYNITNISTDISPNMLKQGYLCFALIKDGANIEFPNFDGRLYINIYKLK